MRGKNKSMKGNEENKMEQGLKWLEKQFERKDWEKVWQSEKSLVEEFVNIIHSSNENAIKMFDVRNNFFKKVICVDYKDNKKYSGLHKDFKCKFGEEMIKSKIDEVNVLALSAFGKKWANSNRKEKPVIKYDEDASLLMNYVYCKIYDIFKKDGGNRGAIVPHRGYKYTIKVGKAQYSGDTMNSWSTTVNEFMRVCGKNYIEGWQERCIPAGYDSWEECLCVPGNYQKDQKALPPYIMDFMEAVYTIGNFMPVLQSPYNFNTCRYQYTKDYWDLTLLAIYDYYRYMSDGKIPSRFYMFLNPLEKWLDEFRTWDGFVEQNSMQPFVKKIGDKRYGEPYELWDGHFVGDVLPKEEWQFEQFFVNARIRILERGKLMAQALIDSYKPKETP